MKKIDMPAVREEHVEDALEVKLNNAMILAERIHAVAIQRKQELTSTSIEANWGHVKGASTTERVLADALFQLGELDEEEAEFFGFV
ncbi:MAG: hypothetical protein AAGJ10_15740 [Bacteroidota bacterium]